MIVYEEVIIPSRHTAKEETVSEEPEITKVTQTLIDSITGEKQEYEIFRSPDLIAIRPKGYAGKIYYPIVIERKDGKLTIWIYNQNKNLVSVTVDQEIEQE